MVGVKTEMRFDDVGGLSAEMDEGLGSFDDAAACRRRFVIMNLFLHLQSELLRYFALARGPVFLGPSSSGPGNDSVC